MITYKVSDWISIDEAAVLLRLSSGKVRRLIEEHSLFAVRVDKEPKIPAHTIIDGEPLSSIRGTLLLLLDIGL